MVPPRGFFFAREKRKERKSDPRGNRTPNLRVWNPTGGRTAKKKRGKKNPLFLFSFLHLLGPFLPKLQLEFWLETLESEQTQVPDRGLVTTFFFPLSLFYQQKKKCSMRGSNPRQSQSRTAAFFFTKKMDSTPHCSRVVPHPSTERAQTALTSVFG